jgi:serpin B
MHTTADSAMHFRYLRTTELEAGELPYGNGAYAMVVVVPRRDVDIDTFAESFDAARWNATLDAMQPANDVEILMPKFTMTFERELKPDLQALGLHDAFDDSADLSGITGRSGPYIGFVKHKTFVTVDEAGTEAAAVTNTGARVVSAPPTFHVDRPFLFVIRERLSGTIAFAGKVVEP